MGAKAQPPKAQDANRLRGIIDRVGTIDLIGNIRAIREARDLLNTMLADAEWELSGGGKVVTSSAAPPRAAAPHRPRREGAKRRPGTETLVEGSVASLAVEAIRHAGRPMSSRELVAALEQQGHNVKLTTMVGSLYRWVKKKKVFYLASPNTFGLVEMRKG